MRYKNIIFDLGNTLLLFDNYKIFDWFFESDNIPEKERREYSEKVFSREYWDRLDDGSLSEEGFFNEAKQMIPEKYHKNLKRLCTQWYENLPAIEGMPELIEKLKKDGHKIFLLSNIALEFEEYFKTYDFHKHFDGYILSGVERTVKPNDEIFKLLLERYSLKAEESIFVDDLEKNIEGAKRNGISGYLFDGDSKNLEAFLYGGK